MTVMCYVLQLHRTACYVLQRTYADRDVAWFTKDPVHIFFFHVSMRALKKQNVFWAIFAVTELKNLSSVTLIKRKTVTSH